MIESHSGWQRGYVLFGVEIDRDVDGTDVEIHLWPITLAMTWGINVRF